LRIVETIRKKDTAGNKDRPQGLKPWLSGYFVRSIASEEKYGAGHAKTRQQNTCRPKKRYKILELVQKVLIPALHK
jgi:hypothetical protein